ncbi:8-oxoguanine deaminase [Vallitalea okinawensis]|uniref:8-oxoguanine deaminase n=1 Tax=Vallitalea okinawensis TaxID=2078660 RepID=UPI000CFB056A|nr:8-oxoguanine deaminase [Vallitalea okinawensis]
MSLLIKNAKAIVTMNRKKEVLEGANILIEGKKITYIGKEEHEATEVIDASNMYVYPGLVNTHHHLYQTFTRNLPDVQNMELFPWLLYLYEIWKNLRDETIYYSSIVGMGELAKYGCTTVFDHHYVFKTGKHSNFIDTQFKAAEDLGMRFHASRGSMSLGKDQGGLPPMEVVQNVEDILYDSERLINKFHDTSQYSMSNIVLAPCSPFSVTTDLLEESAKFARSKGVRLHTHLVETIDEENFCLEKFGKRPLEYMESVGWVGKDVWYAHGIHFNNEELEVMKKTQTGVAHCPISNMKLASGIARISEMVEMDIPVGIAVDGSASNDGSNLLEEIRTGYLLQRLKYSNNAVTPDKFLELATKGGAKILGRDDFGSLEVDMAADLFMVNIDRLQYVGTELDPTSLICTVGIKHPVDYTIINGEVIVKDGYLTRIDEEKIAAEAKAEFRDFISKK